jgi:hypothetical protein
VLKREPARKSAAYRRVCSYIHQAHPDHELNPAFTALRGVWDGTNDHALALADLIEASGRLWPKLAARTDDHQR